MEKTNIKKEEKKVEIFCNRCKKKINKLIGINDKMYVCPKCKVWVANTQYKH